MSGSDGYLLSTEVYLSTAKLLNRQDRWACQVRVVVQIRASLARKGDLAVGQNQ